jgi:hypothetical protein
MAKSVKIDPSHHAVQLVQREGFVCVTCGKCTCCTPDRMEKECRSGSFAKDNHFIQPSTHFAAQQPRPGDFTQSM